MSKRTLALMLAGALALSVLGIGSAGAQEIPEEVSIADPFGDANALGGDIVTPRDASTVGDLGKIWFTNTAETISVHIQTELPPPSSTGSIYDVFTNQAASFTGYTTAAPACSRTVLRAS